MVQRTLCVILMVLQSSVLMNTYVVVCVVVCACNNRFMVGGFNCEQVLVAKEPGCIHRLITEKYLLSLCHCIYVALYISTYQRCK